MRAARLRGSALVLGVVAGLLGPVVACGRQGAGPRDLARPRLPTTEATTAGAVPTSPAPTTVVTSLPTTTTTTAAPPTTARPRALAANRLPATVDAYRGLGTWVDVYDWSATFGGPRGGPSVGPADVDRMAEAGVQTLFIQTARWDVPAPVLEPERLVPIIRRAQARGLRVVAWYLPTLVDPAADLAKLLAAARLGVQGLAVDIESRDVADPAERTRRLLGLSAELRRRLPGEALGAIVMPPVVTDVINPGYWPGFPWRELVPSYDIWLPMAYWTTRPAASGWRDGYRYTIENITRLRQNLGVPGAPVHLIGGVGDKAQTADIGGMRRGGAEHGVLGASLYDWRTTAPDWWPILREFRVP